MTKKLLAILLILSCFTATAFAQNNPGIVMMYHDIIKSGEESSYTLLTQNLENDINILMEKGYRFCSPKEQSELTDKSNTVCLTFDDGYEGMYTEVLPLLKKYNIKACVFITGSYIGKKGLLTKEEIKEMAESDYFEIGNHSYSIHNEEYNNLWDIYKTNPKSVIDDFMKNQEVLEDIIGKKVTTLSYPYGIYTQFVNEVMLANGLITFSSDPKGNSTKYLPYPRFNRTINTTVDEIVEKSIENPEFRGFGDGKIHILSNGVSYDGDLIIKDSSMMVPIEYLAKSLNCKIKCEDGQKKVDIADMGNAYKLNVEEDYIIANTDKKKIHTLCEVNDDKLYVPLREVCEIMGKTVKYDDKNRTVVIY